jgi:hypothetical protein
MTRPLILACTGLLLGLSGCADHATSASPTSDQVIGAQYRARGDRGAISGPEAGAIMDAYRQQIARPPEAQSPSSENRDDR